MYSRYTGSGLVGSNPTLCNRDARVVKGVYLRYTGFGLAGSNPAPCRNLFLFFLRLCFIHASHHFNVVSYMHCSAYCTTNAHIRESFSPLHARYECLHLRTHPAPRLSPSITSIWRFIQSPKRMLTKRTMSTTRMTKQCV